MGPWTPDQVSKARNVSFQAVLEHLGAYYKRDPDYTPLDTSSDSVRVHVNYNGRDFRFIFTNDKWVNELMARECASRGGGGAVDFVKHIARGAVLFRRSTSACNAIQRKDRMSNLARKIVLPRFRSTVLSEETDRFATRIAIDQKNSYFVRPKSMPSEAISRDGVPRWVESQFHLFPVVLQGNGAPWAEASLWLLSQVESKVNPNMASFASVAEDLTAFRRFIEEYDLDWTNFPSQKLHRPTYRFNGHLKHLVQSQHIKPSTAKRRMAAVIRFYRWLVEEKVISNEHPLWKESDRYIQFHGQYGDRLSKKVVTTDVSIRVAKQDDPYDGRLDDGGKLRPLSYEEQAWLLDGLVTLGNTEMTLIHLFALVTGARIQTILTFRVKDVSLNRVADAGSLVRIPVGLGTGIDTKYDKKLVLHVPLWFYQLLQTYAASDRAKARRERANGGDTDHQYLFLSIRGAPLYSAKSDQALEVTQNLRHRKGGQGVRQYMTDYIIPFIQKKHDPAFHYQFHDTRATFGMNLVDDRLRLVEAKQLTLKEVIAYVQTRMGHASSATTERYISFRSRLKIVQAVQDGWEARLQSMAQRALEGAR